MLEPSLNCVKALESGCKAKNATNCTNSPDQEMLFGFGKFVKFVAFLFFSPTHFPLVPETEMLINSGSAIIPDGGKRVIIKPFIRNFERRVLNSGNIYYWRTIPWKSD